MTQPAVVLAYSGGLDTSCILKYLQKQGLDVIAFVADVGQQDDFDKVADNARRIGAKDVVIAKLKREFVTDYIYPAISGNALYEGRYLLGTALARPVIAKHQVRVALEHNAHYVAHGATGKGNDQVRFEFGYAALAPTLKIIAPWKDPAFFGRFKGRSDLIAYARAEGIDIPVSLEKPFSTDENLMHKSYESGLLEDPNKRPDADMFTVCKSPKDAPDQEALIELTFKDGLPVRLSCEDGKRVVTEPLALFEALNALGAKHGIGRIDIVENRFIGIKSRGVYETPGGTILHAARRDLEGVTMDGEVLRLRDSLSTKFTQLIYNGFWFSPEMAVVRCAMDKCAERVDGTVTLTLYKGLVSPVARTSPQSLYDQDLSSMDMEGEFNQADAQGFIHIHALRLKAQNRRRA